MRGAADSLFATHPECPSELALDRLHLGESTGLDGHLASCTRCQARMELRRSGFAAFPSTDPEQIFAKLAPAATPKKSRVPTWSIAASAALVIALIAIVYPKNQIDTLRPKGDSELTVYRERAGSVVRISSADKFREKDRLRFAVPPELAEREIMIVSVEKGGEIFAFYPSDGTQRSQAPKTDEDGILSGAIELDASLAEEWLHLVSCPKSFGLGDLEPGERPDLLAIPEECSKYSVLLAKENSP